MCALLAVDERGQGDPLVLIHGLATTRWIWELVTPALAERRRVITLDLPGFGESPPVDEGFSLEQVAERIVRGLAARQVRGPYDLVGHSLGGAVATVLAAAHPALVRRLVLVAPAGFGTLSPAVSRMIAAAADPLLAARRALAPAADFAWGRRLLLAVAAADGATIPPAIARQMVAASASARRTAAALDTIAAESVESALAGTEVPLGVIWGRWDLTVPRRLLAPVQRARPDATVEWIARAGHVPMIERPDAFVAAVERLIDGPH